MISKLTDVIVFNTIDFEQVTRKKKQLPVLDIQVELQMDKHG